MALGRTTHAPTESGPRVESLAAGLVRGMRPRQWTKNVLVLAAPVAAGEITDPEVLWSTAIAFVAFVLASSGVYLFNDASDVEEDRRHPRKRLRPVAQGSVPVPVAYGASLALMAAGIGTSLLAGIGLTSVVAVYVVMQVAYCLWLKHQAVIDIAVVSSGFLLRAIAGGMAAGIELSQWFVLAAVFGSLFIASGKRYSEARLAPTVEGTIRKNLDDYSPSYLRFVWGTAAATLIMTYGLWAFEIREQTGSILAAISMGPFIVAVLRYAVDVDSGNAGEPETIVLNDRLLQVLGLVWVVLLAGSVYGA